MGGSPTVSERLLGQQSHPLIRPVRARFYPSVGRPLFGHDARMTVYTRPDLVGLLRRTLKRTHPDVSTMELTALFRLVSQTRRHSPTPSIGEPSIEARIIKLEATSRAAARRSRAIPARSRGEAREALRASERTQSNEAVPGGTHIDPARQQRQGGLDPVFRYHPYCPRRRSSTAPLHRLL